jgi:hypothetical protein
MGDAIESMLLEEQLRQFAEAGLVEGGEMRVEGLFGSLKKGVSKVFKKAGGVGNVAAAVVTGPQGQLASLATAAGLPPDIAVLISPQAAVYRGIFKGASKGIQESKGNIAQRALGGAQGAGRGGLKGAGDVVRSPLIKKVATGIAFVFPPVAAVVPAMTAADKLLTKVEGNDLVQKALAMKSVNATATAARAGDVEAKRGLALLAVAKVARHATPPTQATAGQQTLGYLVTVAGKALRGRFKADPKGFPGIIAIPGGQTVRGTWSRA